MADFANVKLEGLQTLQSELRSMSENLQQIYDTLWGNLNILGEDWQDEKFEEFTDEFKQYREKIIDLSEKYKDWADKYIQERIDKVEKYSGTSAGI